MTADDVGRGIRALADGLGVDYGFERSFKIAGGRVLTNRFLLGFHRRQLGTDPQGRVRELAHRMGMPGSLERPLMEAFGEADLVHLGFEEGAGGATCKLYLEFTGRLRVHPRPVDPVLLFLGYKWEVGGERAAVTRYVCHPMLPLDVIMANVEQIYGNRGNLPAPAVVRGLLEASMGRVGIDEILYLSVDEDHGDGCHDRAGAGDDTRPHFRRSFDLNVYRAGFRVGDLAEALRDIGHAQGAGGGEIDAVVDARRHERLGHVSGGVDHQGRDFFTVYYGVERVRAPARGGA